MIEHQPGECEDADCWAHGEANDEDEESFTPVYDKAGLHVMAEPCSTCIFKPGNLMRLSKGRVKDMTDSTDARTPTWCATRRWASRSVRSVTAPSNDGRARWCASVSG